MSSPRQKVRTLRDFEWFLRRDGFSRQEARTIASAGFKPLVNRQDGSAFDLEKIVEPAQNGITG